MVYCFLPTVYLMLDFMPHFFFASLHLFSIFLHCYSYQLIPLEFRVAIKSNAIHSNDLPCVTLDGNFHQKTHTQQLSYSRLLAVIKTRHDLFQSSSSINKVYCQSSNSGGTSHFEPLITMIAQMVWMSDEHNWHK